MKSKRTCSLAITAMLHCPTTFKIGLLKSTSRESMPTTNTIPHSSTSSHHQLPATTSSTWAPTVLIILCRLSRNMIKSGFNNRKSNNNRLKQVRCRIFRSKWARRDSRCSSQRLFVSQTHICKQLRVPDRRMRWEALMAWIEARRLKEKCSSSTPAAKKVLSPPRFRRPISRACSTSQEQVCASSQRQGNRGPPSATWQWTWLTKHSPARNPSRNCQGKQAPSRPKP